MGEPRNLIVADALYGEVDGGDESSAECGTKRGEEWTGDYHQQQDEQIDTPRIEQFADA